MVNWGTSVNEREILDGAAQQVNILDSWATTHNQRCSILDISTFCGPVDTSLREMLTAEEEAVWQEGKPVHQSVPVYLEIITILAEGTEMK
jgi:hypothetical protein